MNLALFDFDGTITRGDTFTSVLRFAVVVCGFVHDTSAVCWQYSPAARAFVKVGQWVT